jgi:hypothetical protein
MNGAQFPHSYRYKDEWVTCVSSHEVNNRLQVYPEAAILHKSKQDTVILDLLEWAEKPVVRRL